MRPICCLMVLLTAVAGCPLLPVGAPPAEPPDVLDLDRRYRTMLEHLGPFGDGGREVLDVAYRTLRRGRAEGKWNLVGLEDLWAEAVKEGAVLFNKPDRRWGLTRASETDDMFGQNTVGPWQMTISNIRLVYGRPYGIEPDWTEWRVYMYCRERPEVQAAMIADYIQEAYSQHGRRGPYGIQRYFSLSAYVRGQIGQGEWDRSVLAVSPAGDWSALTPEAKANTGFYAKQVLLGTRANPYGLLYWLWVTDDLEAVREALRTWRDQTRMVWDEIRNRPTLTEDAGGFTIRPSDLKYLQTFRECHADIERLVGEILNERMVEGTGAGSTGG